MKIGIYVENFKIYFQLVNELKKRNIGFYDLHQDSSEKVSVVLTDKPRNFPKEIIIDDIKRSLRRALSYNYGKERFQEIVVGIDPGLRTGIVVMGDGVTLEEFELNDLKNVKNILNSVKNDYSPNKFLIRIGMGDIPDRNRIINDILGYFDIELVDETKTSPIKNRNIEAARKIAMKKGELINKRMYRRFKNGEISEVQRRSRLLSNNEITISKKLAIKVLSGEMDIENAIKIQKK
ncbi:MAG: hypothetical protein ACP5F1_01795 [Thermoplasmata archaeon]|nr:hypothetical protein [Thermoplasmata archaeon]